MSVYKIQDMKCIQKLLDGWQETMIWSVLQGCMGNAYADSSTNPKAVQILIADFCFFAGKPDEELVRNKPSDFKSDFVIMTAMNEAWDELIEKVYKEQAVRVTRYAIKKEPDVFDCVKLQNIVDNLDESFTLRMIDEDIFNKISLISWAKDLCGQFANYEDFRNRGIGVVAMKQQEIVSGAASYSVYNDGIEIEIDTREDCRRKGLALACGAKLILACLDRKLYPSWDAQNKGSVALAEKLGYHFDKEYSAYEIYKF